MKRKSQESYEKEGKQNLREPRRCLFCSLLCPYIQFFLVILKKVLVKYCQNEILIDAGNFKKDNLRFKCIPMIKKKPTWLNFEHHITRSMYMFNYAK